MSVSAKNMEAIVKAKAQHNGHCDFPPHTVRMHPIELERCGWEEGDEIAGLTIESDPQQQTGTFRLICDKMEPRDDEVLTVEAISQETGREIKV